MATVASWKIGGSAMPLIPKWVLDKRPPTAYALDGTPKFQGKDSGRLIWDTQGMTQDHYDSLLSLVSNTTTSVKTTITVPNENGDFTTYNCICLRPTWTRVWKTQGIREGVIMEVIEIEEVSA